MLTKSEILSFNLGPLYSDFILSLKQEFTAALVQTGLIKESQFIDDDPTFSSFGSDGKLREDCDFSDGEEDEVYIQLKNRKSEIILCFNLSTKHIKIKFFLDGDIHAQPVIFKEDIFAADVIDACTLWLMEAELNDWVKKAINS